MDFKSQLNHRIENQSMRKTPVLWPHLVKTGSSKSSKNIRDFTVSKEQVIFRTNKIVFHNLGKLSMLTYSKPLTHLYLILKTNYTYFIRNSRTSKHIEALVIVCKTCV